MDRIPIGTLCLVVPSTQFTDTHGVIGTTCTVLGYHPPNSPIRNPAPNNQIMIMPNPHVCDGEPINGYMPPEGSWCIDRACLLPITPDNDIQSEKEEAPTMEDWDKLLDRIAAA